jgi:hypothetical protein
MQAEQDPVDFLRTNFPEVWAALEELGWPVLRGNMSGLRAVSSSGAAHCVDGRDCRSEQRPLMFGPKLQGGVLGVAAVAAFQAGNPRVDRSWIQRASQAIRNANFIPSIHGDDEHHPEPDPSVLYGCGFARLWKQGKFENPKLPVLDMTLSEAEAVVRALGGQVITLVGHHHENCVRLNFVAEKTYLPDASAKNFNLDVWFARNLGIDQTTLMLNAAETVYLLLQERPPNEREMRIEVVAPPIDALR